MSVEGRTLSLREWEGEVMVRAVSYCAMLEGLLGGCALLWSLGFSSHSDQGRAVRHLLVGEAVAGFVPLYTLWAAVKVLSRKEGGRRFLLIWDGFLLIWVATSALGVSFIGVPASDLWTRRDIASLLAIWLGQIPRLFTIYVLLVSPGAAPFDPTFSGVPLAPLGSALEVEGSARGWVSIGMPVLSLGWGALLITRVLTLG